MDNNNYTQYPSQKQALIIVIITMFLTFFAGLLAIQIGISKTEVFLVEILTIVPAVIFVYREKYSFKHIFRLRPINFKIGVTSIFIGFALTILADEIDRLVQLILPMPEILIKGMELSLTITSFYDGIIIIFSAVILAAICEELLFRGFLQTSLENTFDITRAIMLTALLFAIVHFNPWQTIQFTAFAIFLGVLSWKSNSILPTIIVHFIVNSIALLFTNIDKTHFEWYLWKDHVDPAIIVIAGLTLFLGIKLFYRYCDEYILKKSSNATGANC